MRHTIKAEGRAYFHILPNIALALSPHAYKLYGVIVDAAGKSGDAGCKLSTRTLAEMCKMSSGAVANAKRELLAEGLVEIHEAYTDGGRLYHIIKLVDVWARNMAHFTKSDTVHNVNDIKPDTVHNVNDIVHNVNDTVHNVNDTVHNVNDIVHNMNDVPSVSPDGEQENATPKEYKNIRQERVGTRGRTPVDSESTSAHLLIQAWWNALPTGIRPIGKMPIMTNLPAAQALHAAGITAEQVASFVRDTLPSFREWAKAKGAPGLMSFAHVAKYVREWAAKRSAVPDLPPAPESAYVPYAPPPPPEPCEPESHVAKVIAANLMHLDEVVRSELGAASVVEWVYFSNHTLHVTVSAPGVRRAKDRIELIHRSAIGHAPPFNPQRQLIDKTTFTFVETGSGEEQP